jgi:hypothetical protein
MDILAGPGWTERLMKVGCLDESLKMADGGGAGNSRFEWRREYYFVV